MKTTISSAVVQITAAIFGLVFLIYALVYLWIAHRVVTHYDFWRIYDVCLTYDWLHSALLKHNGHSLFFPSFIWLADLRFFHGDQELIFYAGLLLLIISTVLLAIPIWRDESISRTHKTLAMVVLVLGTFWMGRAPIITSGGFTANASLVMIGAEAALLCLPLMRGDAAPIWLGALAVIAGGFVATFSFGVGLAVWPTLLCAGWCLRLRKRCYFALAGAAVLAALIFTMLPPHEPGSSTLPAAYFSPAVIGAALTGLCRLLTAPILYAVAGWKTHAAAHELEVTSAVPLIGGILLLGAAVVLIAPTFVRRDWRKPNMEFIGATLVLFNLFGSLLIVIGRAEHLRTAPYEIAAPRYFFHTTLFLAGLLLLLIHRATSKTWLRWPVYTGVLALPIFLFPVHRQATATFTFGRFLSTNAATALINGVRDDGAVRVLFREPEQVYSVAAKLRRAHLDMFRGNLQDWIGRSKTEVFGERHAPRQLRGQCRVSAIVTSDTGEPAARVAGRIWMHKRVAGQAIVVDDKGKICGVGRSSQLNPLVDRIFLWSKLNPNLGFVGYIRQYDPHRRYAVHSVDGGVVSDETIPVRNAPP